MSTIIRKDWGGGQLEKNLRQDTKKRKRKGVGS